MAFRQSENLNRPGIILYDKTAEKYLKKTLFTILCRCAKKHNRCTTSTIYICTFNPFPPQ